MNSSRIETLRDHRLSNLPPDDEPATESYERMAPLSSQRIPILDSSPTVYIDDDDVFSANIPEIPEQSILPDIKTDDSCPPTPRSYVYQETIAPPPLGDNPLNSTQENAISYDIHSTRPEGEPGSIELLMADFGKIISELLIRSNTLSRSEATNLVFLVREKLAEILTIIKNTDSSRVS